MSQNPLLKVSKIKIVYVFILSIFASTFFALAFLVSTTVSAQDDSLSQDQFDTNYNVEYIINLQGNTSVDQEIQIINKLKDIIATNYTLTIRQMSVYSISAKNSRGALKTEVTEKKDKTIIKADFKDSAIGKGKKNEFTVSYSTSDIATKIGEVWNINIPKVNLLESTKSYNVALTVPKSFGPEIFISPSPVDKTEAADKVTYKLDMNGLRNSGITASFGKFQILNFRLEYTLKNKTYFSDTQKIALPPDIVGVQQVAYNSLEPTPKKLKHDIDRNTIAEYELEPQETLNIKLTGTARILGKQIKPEFGSNSDKIPKDLVRRYTKSTEYWQADSKQIREIAEKLFEPEQTASENAQKAYFFVVNNLDYDFDILNSEIVGRKGAVEALSQYENTGCMEFTDLFISIVRAMGIPARELDGYALVENPTDTKPLSINLKGGDLLHSWAEFYDQKYGWVPVDPTWGSTSGIDYFTKLDTNHLVFVIKGVDPQLPMPAGSYKFDDSKKQVEVGFAKSEVEKDFEPNLILYKSVYLNPIKALQGQTNYKLKNEGNNVVYLSINGQAVPILPSNDIGVYIQKDSRSVTVSDATGKQHKLDLELIDEYKGSPLPVIAFLIVSLLLLYGIARFGIVRLKILQKLPRLPHRRPQDQDQ